MKHLSILLTLLFFRPSAGTAAYVFSDNLRNAYSYLIHFQTDSATALIDREASQQPDNHLVLLYRNYADFLKAFVSEEEADFVLLKKNSAERLKFLSRLKGAENSPFHLYVMAEIYLQQAMVKVKFREHVSAATDVRKAYKLIVKNENSFPTFPLNHKLSGFMHALVGAVPREYGWLVEMAGMEGTIPQGMQELKSLYRTLDLSGYSVYKEEVLFYLATIVNAFSGNDPDAVQLQIWMLPYTLSSPLIRYSYCNMIMKEGKNEEALQLLDAPFNHPVSLYFPILEFKAGLARLRKLDPGADGIFLSYLHRFKGMNYIKAAYQKLAWSALIRGDIRQYHTYMDLCRSAGNSLVDEDKEALSEAYGTDVPNLVLLRARLLFDGGYYREAQSEIAGKPIDSFPRFRDQLEVTYRLARILEHLNQQDKAVEYYLQTLKNGSASHYYFAANSALILGNLSEENGTFDEAEKYYRQCLSLDNHEYQNSIDQKAQAGLDRIRALKEATPEE